MGNINTLKFNIITISIILVAFFTFNNKLLTIALPILFILYAVLSFYSLLNKNAFVFLFISLLAVPCSKFFSFNGLIFSQSLFILITIIGLLYYKIIIKQIFIFPIVILVYLVTVSLGNVGFGDFITGLSLVPFIFVIPFFSKLKINPKTIISFAYIPLIFSALYVYQIMNLSELRISGYVFQANGFALIMTTFLLLMFAKYLFQRKLIDLIICIIYVILIILTGSRTGFVSCIIGVLITYILYGGSYKVNYNSIIIIILLSVITLIVFSSNLFENTRFSEISSEDLSVNRMYIWKDIFTQLGNKVYFGLGLGGYDQIINDIKYNRTPHSYYVSTISSIGIFGLLLLLSYLISIVFKINNFIKLNYNKLSNEDRIIGISLIASFFSLVIASFTNTSSFSLIVALLWFICVGYFYGKINSSYSKKTD